MSHREQVEWCQAARVLFADHFRDSVVVDFGSLDINGCNRLLFTDCNYTGVDLNPGRNVDVVSKCHAYHPPKWVDTVISTEMLEHDETWAESLRHMLAILRPEGLLVFTCASEGRPEHGTRRASPGDSPFTPDYYRNLTKDDVIEAWDGLAGFKFCRFDYEPSSHDLRFFGVKR